MPFHVYILCCADGSYYTGHTDNLERRLAAHERREIAGYTYSRLPVQLVFTEEFSSREEAFQRERQIKGWSRMKKKALKGWSRMKKKALIERDWRRLKELAQGHGSTSSP